MRDILPFVSLIKDIGFEPKIQGYTPALLCSLLKNLFIVHEDSKGAIALQFAPQMQPRTKNIAIKCHHFRSFVANGDVDIQHIDTKE